MEAQMTGIRAVNRKFSARFTSGRMGVWGCFISTIIASAVPLGY